MLQHDSAAPKPAGGDGGDDGDDDFASASSGSQRSESPSPRNGTTVFSSGVGGRFGGSGAGGRFGAVTPPNVGGSITGSSGGGGGSGGGSGNADTCQTAATAQILQPPTTKPVAGAVRAAANGENGRLRPALKHPAHPSTFAAAPQPQAAAGKNGGGSGSTAAGMSDIQPVPDAGDAGDASTDDAFLSPRESFASPPESEVFVSPTASDAEELLPPASMAPLQVPSKRARRVTWAAGVVSPRPRERQRRRRRRWLTGGAVDAELVGSRTSGSFLLACPPDDGELEGFGGARLARTAAAAMALWAHRCSEVVFPLLLAALIMPPSGGHRLTRVPAEHGTMPGSQHGSVGFVADDGGGGGSSAPNNAAGPPGGGNPLLLVAQAAAAAAVLRLAFGERLRSRTAKQPRGGATRSACALHGSLAAAAAALLAAACWLAPPPYARSGSGLGIVEGCFAVAAALAFGVAATGPDALHLGVQRDWLWELLPGAGGTIEPWPREQDVAQGLAVCELGGTLTGGLLLLVLQPVLVAVLVAALHACAWLGGTVLLQRYRASAAFGAAAAFDGSGSGGGSNHGSSDDGGGGGGGSAPEIELSCTGLAGNAVADFGGLHGLNGHSSSYSGSSGGASGGDQQPELPLSYGGEAAAAAAAAAGPDVEAQREIAAVHGLSSTDAGDAAQSPPPARRGWRSALHTAWADLQAWAEQPAAPAAAAAALMHASVLDLGVLMLAFLAVRGVPVVMVAAAAAAAGMAAAAGGALAPALAARFGGLLPGGAVAAAAHMAAAWAAAAPLLAEKATGSPRRWMSDAVLGAALLCGVAARAAFGAAAQQLMERWQEGGDAGVVASVQRRLRAACAAAAAVAALMFASPATLPWLMAASAALATASATVFAAFAVAEWKYCSPGGGLAPVAAAPEGLAAADEEAGGDLETECLIP